MNSLRLPPIVVFMTMSVVMELAFMMFATVASVYRISVAGLDPLQLILVGSVLELSVFLAEVPTGVIADAYSRRLSIIVGFALVGVGFALEGASSAFGAILLAQVVWGVGFTFTSGATQAWLSDELRDDARTARAFVMAAKLETVGAVAGIALSVALASAFIGLALIAAGATFVLLAIFLAFAMSERGFRPAASGERAGWGAMARAFRGGARVVSASRVLMALVAVQIFFGISTEPFDRLWAKHALDTFEFPIIARLDPIIWLGVMQASAALGGLAALWAVEKVIPIEREWAPRVALSAVNAAMIVGVAAFALAGSFALALGMVILIYVMHRVGEPFVFAWINRSSEPESRATVFSLHEQGNSFGQAAFAPFMGALANARGVRVALLASAVMLIPIQALYLVRERRISPRPDSSGP